MEKAELRQLIRQRKQQFSQQQLRELSLLKMKLLLQHPLIQKAQFILHYYSLPDEVDTHQSIVDLQHQGKHILLPAVDGDMLNLREYSSPEDLREGAFHIMEPVGRLFERYDEIDVAIIPGMSFDAQGHRLGRGKGYYDRFLAVHPGIYKIGVCFDFQKTEWVPTDIHDIQMDEVI
jgi:5-formyltetrahydrofolate cyclo-ligase